MPAPKGHEARRCALLNSQAKGQRGTQEDRKVRWIDPLRSHLYLLRQGLDKPFDRPMLKTVHEVGFRLEADA